MTILAFMAAGGWGVYRGTFWYWDRLEETADDLGTPKGMDRLFEQKSGGVFCVITCEKGEAAITVWYRTSLSYRDACKAARQHVEGRFGTVRSNEPGEYEGVRSCPFIVGLPHIKSDARLGASYLSEGMGTCLRSGLCDLQTLPRFPRLKQDEALVWITLNSGIE